MMLPLSFFQRPCLTVAKNLIGKILVRNDRNTIMKAMIVETEAYIGENDSACHAYKGRTARTEIMYQRAGYSYVYFIYGMHYMLNIVTEKEGVPAAVLIRAAEPIEGLEQMAANRKTNKNLCNGPAKLCQALNIDKKQNKLDLTNNIELWLEDDLSIDLSINPPFNKTQIQTSSRIGIDYASQEDKNKQWRFFLTDNPHISQ